MHNAFARSPVGRLLLLVACLAATTAARRDRRIVDRVSIGDARSEREHAFEGDRVQSGQAGGRGFRQTQSWMRYALTVFDDTEVSIGCTFLVADTTSRTFELVVEGRIIATQAVAPGHLAEFEFRVPLELTRGRTNLLVTLRAVAGPTPPLLELRSVQDHNE